MTRSFAAICLIVAVALAAERVDAQTQTAPQQPGQRLDLFGDPLPPGAVARLGTARLRAQSSTDSVSFSADGKKLATAGTGGVYLWDIDTGKLLRTFTGVRHDIDCSVAIAPSGFQIAAVAAGESQVRFWDIRTGKAWLSAPVGLLKTIAFAPDANTYFTGGADSVVRQWRAGAQRPHREFKIDTNERGSSGTLAISPDGRLLAAQFEENGIWIGKLDGQVDPVVINPAHGVGVTSLAFDADGQTLISGGRRTEEIRRADGHTDLRSVSEIRVWDARTGKRLGEVNADNSDFGQGEIALSGDGRLLAARSDEIVRVWDRRSGEMIHAIATKDTSADWMPRGLAISPDGKWLAAGAGADTRVHVWNLTTGERHFPRDESHGAPVRAIAFDPTAQVVATGSRDTTVRLWDARNGKPLRTLSLGDGWIKWLGFAGKGQTLYAAAEEHDVAALKFGGLVAWFDVATGEQRGRVHTDFRLTGGALSSDGKRLAVALGLGQRSNPFDVDDPRGCPIKIFDTSTGNHLCDLAGHDARTIALAFSSDAKTLFAVAEDSTLHHWEIETGNLLKSIDLAGQAILFEAAFSPEAKFLVTARHRPAQLVVRELASQQAFHSIDIPESTPTAIAFSADGQMLACGFLIRGGRTGIRLWELKTGRELGSFEPSTYNRVESLAFSADGKSLASGMGDGTGLIWDLSEARARPTP